MNTIKNVFYRSVGFIFILPAMLGTIHCEAQNFNGFASIRIGISETSFIEGIKSESKEKIQIVTEKNISKVESEWFKSRYNNDPSKIYQLKYKGEVTNWPLALYDNKSMILSGFLDSCNIYFLPKYKLGEIQLENIFIAFRNNSLQLIELDNNYDFLKAAKEKFKPSEDLDTFYKIKCVFVSSGVPEEKSVSKSYTKWDYQEYNIEASSGYDYNEKCKEIAWGYIRFISNNMTGFLNRNSDLEDKKNKTLEKNKINSIKDKL